MLARKLLQHIRAASALLAGPVSCPGPVESDEPRSLKEVNIAPPATVEDCASISTTELPDRSSCQSSQSIVHFMQQENEHLKAELRLMEKLHDQLNAQMQHLDRSGRQLRRASRELEAQRRITQNENQNLGILLEAIEGRFHQVTRTFNKLEELAIFQALNSGSSTARVAATEVCGALDRAK